MKKLIYSGTNGKGGHGLFDILNFDRYIMRRYRGAEFVGSYVTVSCGEVVEVYRIEPQRVIIHHKEREEGQVSKVSVLLEGEEIGGVEKKILGDAKRFKKSSLKASSFA